MTEETTTKLKPYAIDLDVLDGKTPVEQLASWITYRNEGRGVELSLRIRYVSQEEHAGWSKGRDEATWTDADTAWWVAHVTDWRGMVTPDGTPIPYTQERMAFIVSRDGSIGAWLVREAARWDNFRSPSVAPPAVPVHGRAGSAGAGSVRVRRGQA